MTSCLQKDPNLSKRALFCSFFLYRKEPAYFHLIANLSSMTSFFSFQERRALLTTGSKLFFHYALLPLFRDIVRLIPSTLQELYSGRYHVEKPFGRVVLSIIRAVGTLFFLLSGSFYLPVFKEVERILLKKRRLEQNLIVHRLQEKEQLTKADLWQIPSIPKNLLETDHIIQQIYKIPKEALKEVLEMTFSYEKEILSEEKTLQKISINRECIKTILPFPDYPMYAEALFKQLCAIPYKILYDEDMLRASLHTMKDFSKVETLISFFSVIYCKDFFYHQGLCTLQRKLEKMAANKDLMEALLKKIASLQDQLKWFVVSEIEYFMKKQTKKTLQKSDLIPFLEVITIFCDKKYNFIKKLPSTLSKEILFFAPPKEFFLFVQGHLCEKETKRVQKDLDQLAPYIEGMEALRECFQAHPMHEVRGFLDNLFFLFSLENNAFFQKIQLENPSFSLQDVLPEKQAIIDWHQKAVQGLQENRKETCFAFIHIVVTSLKKKVSVPNQRDIEKKAQALKEKLCSNYDTILWDQAIFELQAFHKKPLPIEEHRILFEALFLYFRLVYIFKKFHPYKSFSLQKQEKLLKKLANVYDPSPLKKIEAKKIIEKELTYLQKKLFCTFKKEKKERNMFLLALFFLAKSFPLDFRQTFFITMDQCISLSEDKKYLLILLLTIFSSHPKISRETGWILASFKIIHRFSIHSLSFQKDVFRKMFLLAYTGKRKEVIDTVVTVLDPFSRETFRDPLNRILLIREDLFDKVSGKELEKLIKQSISSSKIREIPSF